MKKRQTMICAQVDAKPMAGYFCHLVTVLFLLENNQTWGKVFSTSKGAHCICMTTAEIMIKRYRQRTRQRWSTKSPQRAWQTEKASCSVSWRPHYRRENREEVQVWCVGEPRDLHGRRCGSWVATEIEMGAGGRGKLMSPLLKIQTYGF